MALALGLWGQTAMATEEPAYEKLSTHGHIELRRYAPFIVAETTVAGDMDAASNKGFRAIADYIFGNNVAAGAAPAKGAEKIAMTAPVALEPVSPPPPSTQTIAMTAPVALQPLPPASAQAGQALPALQGGQEQALQELTQVQSSLSALLTDTMERAALEAATSQAQALKASLDAAQKLKAAGDAAALQAHIQGKLKALQSAQQDMVRLTERGATELRDKAGNERLKTVWGVAGIMAIIIAAVCIGTRLVQRSVTEPLADIVRVTRSIGEGDLTVRIVTDRQDEMGEVLRALAQMSNSLAELVGQVQRSAGSIGAASVEIAHGNHDLSNRTEATAANLQRASSTLDHLNGVVGQSAASAREANALAASAYTVA